MRLTKRQWQQKLDQKFGVRKVRVVNTPSKGKITLTIGDITKTIPVRSVHDRTRAETLFSLDPAKTKKIGYALVRDRRLSLSRDRIRARLDSWGLNSFSFKENTSANTIVFTSPKDDSFELKRTYWWNSTSSARDFLCRFYAWTRFKSTVPLKYTDREWRELVETRTAGKITSARYIPGGNAAPQVVTCTRCSLTFEKIRIFNSKHAVLRCPTCDARQTKSYSRLGVEWTNDLSDRLGIKIRNASHPKGEVRITLKNRASTFVDGFYKNIVFELHGSRWHGNPAIFYLDEHPNPYNDTPTLTLLRKTLNRELAIAKAGYLLVRIWDTDYLSEEAYKRWLLKNLKRIQEHLR